MVKLFTVAVTMEIYNIVELVTLGKPWFSFIRDYQWQVDACKKLNLFILTVYDQYYLLTFNLNKCYCTNYVGYNFN